MDNGLRRYLFLGTGRRIHDGWDVAVLSIGPIGNDVEKAVKLVEGAESSTSNGHCPSIAHYDMRFLKPLDEKILEEVGNRFSRIITIEDGVRNGGLGSAVTEWMSDHGYTPHITRMGLPDHFVEQGTVQQLREICGIDIESIKKQLLDSNE